MEAHTKTNNWRSYDRMVKAEIKHNARVMKVQKLEKKYEFTCLPPSLSPQLHPYPWLLVSHGKHVSGHQFYCISEKQYYARSIPNLRKKKIHNISFGWLIVEDYDSNQLSLVNMQSLEDIQLPQPCFDDFSCSILLFPPGNPKCLVVFFTHSPSTNLSTIFFCKPGDIEFHQYIIGDVLAGCIATVLGGKIYCLKRENYELLLIDFCDISEPRITTAINESSFDFNLMVPPYVIHNDSYLIEFCGEIFLVVQRFKGSHTRLFDSFTIFRADLSEKMTWVKVKSIGDNCAIFLGSGNLGVCCRASTEHGVKGNTVYFVQNHDHCFYSYDLLRNSYSVAPPCPNVNLRRTTKLKHYWIPT